ncbi:polysaccharide biosynthesis family protein [Oceanobacillus oncorhynchi subsp. incaldanensis]|uniref:Putative cell division protein YtgP n=1 Tax=Oceanobacillus oncorhynchi TaxID=545501 RepID=A0A0A1MKJ4_9BACI|nr:polysaccharide biosynthesis protein [Oceanobacillus oncorhynchi]GIO20910.1 polysaccharide biosynthesis family protein [Oceanobacillus oncorhynchi subsp. incaldanensis]CEI80227.1 putative cell division protein YtgP [Oceanobacillus oncorhynchi]
MSDNETSRLVKGAVVLSIAGLISKVLSAVYRIVLQNLTGDIGFYMYQQLYPLLGIATMLALYGFPSAISSLTATELEKGRALSWRGFYRPILFILGSFHLLLIAIVYFTAPLLARLAGDERFVGLYQVTAAVFLIVPVLALFRGIQQGKYEMAPTAFSQIGEQFIRVGTIIAGALLVSQGIFQIDAIGTTAVLASLLGGVSALVVLVCFYYKNRKHSPADVKAFSLEEAVPWKKYVKTLLLFGVAAAMNHMTLLFMQLADAFTFVPRLMASGAAEIAAKEMKGVFDRGQPLIQVVTIIGSSIALAIIPAINYQKLKKQREQVMNYIQTAMHVGIFIAIGAVLGLFIIFPEVNQLLYKNIQGTSELRLLIIAIGMSTISIIGASILQSLGMIVRTAVFIGISFVVKVGSNLILIPHFEVYGASIATILSLSVLLLLVGIELYRKLPSVSLYRSMSWKSLAAASLSMVIYLLVMQRMFSALVIDIRLLLLIYVLFISVSGAGLFLFVLLKTGGLTEAQIRILPKSAYMLRIYHKGRKKP